MFRILCFAFIRLRIQNKNIKLFFTRLLAIKKRDLIIFVKYLKILNRTTYSRFNIIKHYKANFRNQVTVCTEIVCKIMTLICDRPVKSVCQMKLARQNYNVGSIYVLLYQRLNLCCKIMLGELPTLQLMCAKYYAKASLQ